MLLFFYKLVPGEDETRPEAVLTCLPEEDDEHYDDAIVCELPLIPGADAEGRACCTLALPEQIDGCPLTALEDFAPEEDWSEGEPVRITGLSLPASLRRIRPEALEWMNHLERIEVSPENPVFEAVDGVLYDRENAALVRCPVNRPGEWLAVKPGTRTIRENGLARCRNLRSILLPEGLTTLEAYAAAACSRLEYIALPDGLTAMEKGCLMHCKSLPWLRIPEEVERIGDGAFLECASLAGVEFSPFSRLRTLGDHAFQRCNRLAGITLPAGLTAVPGRCFDGCVSLRRIWFACDHGTSAVELVDYEAFKGCRELEEIELPEGLRTVAQYAFEGCTALRLVSLPQTLESVVPGSRTANGMPFGGCVSLEQITVAEGNPRFAIHDGALTDLELGRIIRFPQARRQQSYTVPQGMRIIGVEAFSGCDALEKILLPDGLETIENGAFSGCTALASPDLPASLSRLGQGAFSGCTSLREAVLPEGVKSISRNAYEGCTALRRVLLPGTVKRLEYGAFEGCTALEEIMLPEGLTSLGNRAFLGCTSLRRVVLPRSLTSIDVLMNTFENCPRLELHIPRGSFAEEYFTRFCRGVKKTYY